MGDKAVRVLLVDDDPMALEMLRIVCAELKWNIVGEAVDGRQGVRLYRELRPDLVLLDVEMPTQNGIEALKEIKREFPNACAVMLTSTDPDHTMDYSFSAGAVDFVRKEQGLDQVMGELQTIKQRLFG